MNKWSFLLLPVLWLVQSATSERIFVDGRHGRFDYPSRSLLSNKRLAISEPRCSDKINELRSPTRDLRPSNKHDTLKRSPRSNHRLEQSELFSGNSKRVSTNVPFRFGDSTRYNTDDNTFLRGIEDSKLRTNVRSGPHKIYRENRADRILDSYNEPNPIKMQRNRERNIKMEQDKIVILKSRNIRDLSRSDFQDVSFERNNVRESRTAERRNNNMERRLNINNQRYELSDEMEIRGRYMVARLERGRYINKRSPVLRFNERDESERNDESRLKVESYSDQRLQRHRVRVDSLPENRQIRRQEVRFDLKNGDNPRYISIQNIERFFEPGTTTQIRGNSLYRLHEEKSVDHLTRNMRDNLRIAENGHFETSNRRNKDIRRTITERRERDDRYRLANENRRSSDVREIRLVKERHLENMLDENRDTKIILLNNKEQTFKDRLFEEVRERSHDNIRLNRKHIRSIQTDNRNGERLARDTNRRLMTQRTRTNRIVLNQRSTSNYKNIHNEDRDILRHIKVELSDENRIRQLRNIRENREENNRDGIVWQFERTQSNIRNRNQAVRSARMIPKRSVERIELTLVALPEKEINNNQKIIKERLGKENRFSRLRISKRIRENDEVGATTMKTSYNNHAIEDTERNNNRNTRSRNEGERLASRDQRSFNLRKYNVENENRMRNRHMRLGMNVLQRSRSDERILSQLYSRRNFRNSEERTRTIDEIPFAKTDNTNDNFRLNKRASVEIRAVEMPNIRVFKRIEKRDNGRRMLRDINSVIETREDRLKIELRDRRSRITEQNKILIRYEEGTFDFSANRLFEPQRGVINEYRMRLTRNENNNNRRMREIREVRGIKDKSDIRDSRQEETMRPTITVDLSNKSNRNVQTRQVTRDINEIAEKRFMSNVRINERKSKNMLRDLQGPASDRRRETNRDSKTYTSNRDSLTPVQDEGLERSREMRFISNSRSERHHRSLSRSQTNGQELVMGAAIKRSGYEIFKEKNQADSQIFVMKWQYVFYLIQGVYILSLFTKQKNYSHGLKSRFVNCFLPLPTLKLD
ncbi:putative uncharacterized protein DDB_G0282133 [Danaus plexippus]|uniref:putative uncharacterized protein DDB_G0282133 n=1 Tax=Danaus plexippus TaxID=13037 RepID=UPI002AB26916|nr:putative uncharacterized protein DDB_G0282133 [Danaus plexippus]